MRALILLSFIPAAALTVLYPTRGMGQCAPPAAPAEAKADMLRLSGSHQAVSCLKQQEATPPVATAPGNAQTSLSYQDQYFKLGCAVSGFKEYFAPSRWTVAKINGDGGVDVTGAPNSILVEGANRASVIATPGSAASYRIAIPAKGYVSFDWGYVGGSNFLNQQFWVEVNGQPVETMTKERTDGSFFSSLLLPGDELAFNITAARKGFAVQLSNFEFLSNAIGVIERRWEAHTEDGLEGRFTQFVSIKKPDFTKVIFPGNCDGIDYPLIENGSSAEPVWTGYPVIDEDGSAATTHDQYPLSGDGCAFNLKWEDELLYDQGDCIIFRHWAVSDYCGNNVQKHTQVIKVRGGCPEGASELPYGQHHGDEGDTPPPGLSPHSASALALQPSQQGAFDTVASPGEPRILPPTD